MIGREGGREIQREREREKERGTVGQTDRSTQVKVDGPVRPCNDPSI